MPVKWIADRGARRGGLPRLGKIKKGEPAKDGKSFPTNQDRFRLLSDQPRVVEAWAEIFGKEPVRAFTAYLPNQDVRANWDYWFEEWTAGGLVFRCDGEQMVLKKQDTRYVDAWEPCPYHSGQKERTTKVPGDQLIGRLAIILPAFLERGIVGTFTLETGSSNDCSNWDAAIEAAAARNGGDCRGIPLRIYRSEEMIWKVANGKRFQAEDWLVRIEPEAQWLAARLGSSDIAEGEYDVDPHTGEVMDDPFGSSETPPPNVATQGPPPSDQHEDTPPSGAPETTTHVKPHWIENRKVQKAFWAYTGDLGLDGHDVHAALGVNSVKEFMGSMADAKAKIEEYVTEQSRQGEDDDAVEGVMPPVEELEF